MLLEIENQLHRRVHSAVGQSAVVLRLAEELDQSGRVAEQAMIIVSYVSGRSTNEMGGGADMPTVRTRSMTYSVTLVQKQAQREGHSFSLPVLDLIADAVTGWVPEVPGLEFATGFELDSERFVQVTEASQFIYEQNYTIQVSDFLPTRKCLQTQAGEPTGLAVWTRVTGPESTESYIVEDLSACDCPKGTDLTLTCGAAEDGSATYKFVPKDARTIGADGSFVIDQSKVVEGGLQKVWKCDRTKSGPYPDWFKLKVKMDLWRNETAKLGEEKEYTAQRFGFKPDEAKLLDC